MSEHKLKAKQKQINFRVSDDEYQYLSAIAEQTGMSVPQLCKQVALGMKYRAPKVELEGAILIAKELRKYGSNLNQIARYCNTMKGSTLSLFENEKISNELKNITKGLTKLWEQLLP